MCKSIVSAIRNTLLFTAFIAAHVSLAEAAETPQPPKAAAIASTFTDGNSVIRGRIWTKGALLARKVYPPEGSIVTIVLLTDELRLWFDRQKNDPQLKENSGSMPPKEIAAHFSYARISNKGEFVFERLKPGAYLLMATAGIENNRQSSQTVGRVDQYVGQQHVGSYNVTETSSYKTMQHADLQEFVIIDVDGKEIEVELKKRKIWDSPWR